MAYSSAAVANAFIAIAHEAGECVSNLVLQKIVYFAHGWYLGLTGTLLVADEVQAWTYGPVFPLLYHSLRKYGAGPVTEQILTFDAVPVDSEDFRFLRAVYDRYHSWDPGSLVALTHKPGSPWRRVGGAGYNQVIPSQMIKEYYADQINEDK